MSGNSAATNLRRPAEKARGGGIWVRGERRDTARPWVGLGWALATLLVGSCGANVEVPAPETPIFQPIQVPPTPAAAAPAAVPTAVENPSPPAPPQPEFDSTLPTEIQVAGDLKVLAAHGPKGNRRAIVYLHGVCGDVTKYQAWSTAAVSFGTVVAVRGDDKCKEPGRYKWGDSVGRTDKRLVAAVRAVSAVRGEPLDTGALVLVGYSQGAARAEGLVRTFPDRYPRAVLVAGPKEHAPSSFTKALAIAVVGGEKDLTLHLVDSVQKARKAGVHAKYFLLPGARHGDYGPQAVKVMGEVLEWTLQ
ncbi:MAG: hypothetical protein IPK82_39100 [Polyangiaceae bacterium]|nr:hypothetical protein [Polyangiaceae bacterium]